MKALTLWQPWASFIARGVKQYETRNWETNYRGPLAIHAAKRPVSLDVFDFLAIYSDIEHVKMFFPLQSIVAIVELVAIHPADRISVSEKEKLLGDYSPGRFAWELKLKEKLEKPIPAKGKPGLWDWET